MIQWGDAAPTSGVELHGSLTDDYVVPPFSVLDTRQGYWQERRRRWLSLGIESELGRDDNLLSLAPAEQARARWALASGDGRAAGIRTAHDTPGNVYQHEGAQAQGGSVGTSIFDPVLCELVYRWWAPPGGLVLDPFCGGSVRGIVAAKLGHPYTGVDLSERQVNANRRQGERLLGGMPPVPVWCVGDAAHLTEVVGPLNADLVFTCPPYYDLEVYSDDPRDLSAMENYGTFLEAYRAIIAAAVGHLRHGRFCVLVVSEVRDKRGVMRGLVADTIAAMRDAGLELYNDAVLVNSAGSLPLRVGKYMAAGRKLGRAHQNVLVGIKGGWDEVRGWSIERDAPPAPQLRLWEEE